MSLSYGRWAGAVALARDDPLMTKRLSWVGHPAFVGAGSVIWTICGRFVCAAIGR
jgi:hypothetical protein